LGGHSRDLYRRTRTGRPLASLGWVSRLTLEPSASGASTVLRPQRFPYDRLMALGLVPTHPGWAGFPSPTGDLFRGLSLTFLPSCPPSGRSPDPTGARVRVPAVPLRSRLVLALASSALAWLASLAAVASSNHAGRPNVAVRETASVGAPRPSGLSGWEVALSQPTPQCRCARGNAQSLPGDWGWLELLGPRNVALICRSRRPVTLDPGNFALVPLPGVYYAIEDSR